MTTERRGFSTAGWTALTALGLVLGAAAGVPLAPHVETWLGVMLVLPVVGAVMGVALGAAQWILLPEGLSRPGRWILATSVGMAVGLTLGTVAAELSGLERAGGQLVAAVLLIGLVTGAAVGASQAVALAGEGIARTRWVAACAAGTGLGSALGWSAASVAAGATFGPAGFAALVVAGGLGLGAATGASLRAAR